MNIFSVKFVQITYSEKHTSSKIEALISFIEAMNTHVIDFVFICQSSNFDRFKVPQEDNSLDSFRNVNNAIDSIYENKKLASL